MKKGIRFMILKIKNITSIEDKPKDSLMRAKNMKIWVIKKRRTNTKDFMVGIEGKTIQKVTSRVQIENRPNMIVGNLKKICLQTI